MFDSISQAHFKTSTSHGDQIIIFPRDSAAILLRASSMFDLPINIKSSSNQNNIASISQPSSSL